MKIRVLFFGALADITGKKEISILMSEIDNVDSAIKRIRSEHPGFAEHNLRYALNQEYVKGGEPIKAGDELAIFTAVSGG